MSDLVKATVLARYLAEAGAVTREERAIVALGLELQKLREAEEALGAFCRRATNSNDHAAQSGEAAP